MTAWISKGAALAVAMGIGVAVAAGGALAQNASVSKGKTSAGAHAAHMRHENFEKLGKTFKGILDQIKKPTPDMTVLAASTKTMVTLANALPTWFPKGSGVEARPKSEAKANIWTDAAGFSAKASALQVEVTKLNQAALSGDLGAFKAQIRPTGAACKGCHDTYRLEEKKG